MDIRRQFWMDVCAVLLVCGSTAMPESRTGNGRNGDGTVPGISIKKDKWQAE